MLDLMGRNGVGGGGRRMPIEWIDYKGKRILYVDYRGLGPDEVLKEMKESDAVVRAARGKVLYLGNIENAVVSGDVMGELRQYAERIVRRKFARLAVVGVTGAMVVSMEAFLGMVSRSLVQVRSFATEAEGLDWLAE